MTTTAYDKSINLRMLDDLFDALKINKCIATFLSTRKICIVTLFHVENRFFTGEGKNFETAMSIAIKNAQDHEHLMEYPNMPCHFCANTIDVRDIGKGNLRCSACRSEMGIASND